MVNNQLKTSSTPVCVTVYTCSECDHIDENCAGPLYECGSCGSKFNADKSRHGSHQCECGKFASKEAERSCVECGEGEVEEAQGFQCVCHDEWHLL